MKYALISPYDSLKVSSEVSDFYMVLAWALKEVKYHRFYCSLKQKLPFSYVICDNGANEEKICTGLEFIKTAKNISADELIAPDVYLNKSETIKNTNDFLDKNWIKHIVDQLKVMAVPQGKSKEDYLECYEMFLKDPRINVLGIGYRCLINAFEKEIDNYSSIEWENMNISESSFLKEKLTHETYIHTMSRVYFLHNYVNFKLLKKYNKRIHLLGLWNPYELSFYKRVFNKDDIIYIRSCDSAAPFQAAQARIEFDKSYGVLDKPKKMLDFYKETSKNDLYIAKNNINIIKEWIGE